MGGTEEWREGACTDSGPADFNGAMLEPYCKEVAAIPKKDRDLRIAGKTVGLTYWRQNDLFIVRKSEDTI